MGGAAALSRTLTTKILKRDVPPDGQEHVCVVVELSNDAPVWVNRVSATLSGGSHHLIVDRRPANTALIAEPQVCTPTMGGDTSRLIIAQQKETSIQLPAGVAFKLEARQRLFLQLHYFNVDQSAHDVSGSLELHLFDSSAGAPIEAKNQFTGSMQINIPAGSTSEAKWFFVPPSPNGKRRVFALTSHTHRLGIRSTIERVMNMNAPETTPLHVSTMWSEPPLTVLDPPLEFDGSDGFRLTCRYQNTTDSVVRFGVEAQDEMCFMWLYYYDAK